MSVTALAAPAKADRVNSPWPAQAYADGQVGTPRPCADAPNSAGSPSFITLVAHELRAPLAALRTSAELLTDGWMTLGTADVRGLVSIIQGSSSWLEALVENLLCDAAIQGGHFRVMPRPTDVSEIMEDVLLLIKPILSRKRQHLRVARRAGVSLVLADRRRIAQVIVNLVNNASKYSAPDVPIDLAITSQGSAVRIAVSDRGPGLPQGANADLFRPFYRSAGALAGNHEGAGLGLSIVNAIVQAHGGAVGASNRRLGGARFWFDIPAVVTRSNGPSGVKATVERRNR